MPSKTTIVKPQLRRSLSIAATAALSAATFAATTATAGAQSLPRPRPPRQSRRSVFVQTDNPAGNQIDVFAARRDGQLLLSQTVSTGGLGGQTACSGADHLASQDSLVYDSNRQLLFAVNAGSDTLSVLSLQTHHVRLVQVLSSGGAFPVRVAFRVDSDGSLGDLGTVAGLGTGIEGIATS
ncbi:MAG: beta-propeller fold lactonase family protein [Acidimicrobiales bacterium]